MSELDEMMRMGIVMHGKKMAWAWGGNSPEHRGKLRRAPHWLRKAIVHSWNFVACRIWGHDWIPDFSETGPPIREDDDGVWYDWDNVEHRLCTACSRVEVAERGGVPVDLDPSI